MKLFTDEAIEAAKEQTLELYRKLATYKPDDKLTSDDITRLMYYLKDYRNELTTIEYNREKSRREEARRQVKRWRVTYIDKVSDRTSELIVYANTLEAAERDALKERFVYQVLNIIEA